LADSQTNHRFTDRITDTRLPAATKPLQIQRFLTLAKVALRRPRPEGRNERAKAPLFRRLTLRSATGTAQRAVPTSIVCERHIPEKKQLDKATAGFMLARNLHGSFQ
jgi:hypothetical protein